MEVSAKEFRSFIENEGKVTACRRFIPSIESDEQANTFIHQYVMSLLTMKKYGSAASVLLGSSLFDPRPLEVRRIWGALQRHALVLVMAAGSTGKSYSITIFEFLRWLADPFFTEIKIVSTTSGHAKANTFSTLGRIRSQCVIPIPGEATSEYIGMDSKDRKSGLSVVAIPAGDDGKARLKGFHPQPRPKPHPTFGPSGFVGIFMDECEDIPAGAMEGVDNAKLSMHDGGPVQIVGAFNPKDQTSKIAQAGTPPNGWDSFDVDTGVDGKNEWVSKEGWHVIRIDGKDCENVKQRKVVYGGFITFDGYTSLEEKNGGNTPEYYSLARGCYAPDSANAAIITSSILNRARGEFTFVGRAANIGSVDIAVDGRDNCVFTRGRCGMASGFQPRTGPKVIFREPRMAVQADQQFECKKGDTKIVGDSIIAHAKGLSISPEYLGVDATGNGAAVWSYIRAQWGDEVIGVNFSEAASNSKILAEDRYTCEELYDGIVTEVWYALRFWMEFGFFGISPNMKADPLDAELLGRRYVLSAGKLLKVEKKDDFIKRLGRSPDYADSLTILGQVARKRERMMGNMNTTPQKQPPRRPVQHGIVDQADWMVEGV